MLNWQWCITALTVSMFTAGKTAFLSGCKTIIGYLLSIHTGSKFSCLILDNDAHSDPGHYQHVSDTVMSYHSLNQSHSIQVYKVKSLYELGGPSEPELIPGSIA